MTVVLYDILGAELERQSFPPGMTPIRVRTPMGTAFVEILTDEDQPVTTKDSPSA